jgi:tetratricopeptide (TPR) repeat protein
MRQIEISPKNPQLYILQGRLLVAMKDFGLAEASYKKAIELDATSMAAYVSLAELYRATGKLDQAIKEYEGVIAKNPKWVPGYLLLGMIHESQKDYVKAQASYEAALKVEPKFAPAANNLAYILSEQGGDLDQALAYAETAHELAPNDPSVADTLGWIYYKKQIYLKAVDFLKDAAAKLPDNPVVQYHFGMAQFKKGDTIGAKKNLQAALKLSDTFPGSEEAKKTLQAL